MRGLTTFARVLIIAHLCLVFTLVAWKVLSPWVTKAVERQETLALLETAMESPYFSMLSPEKKTFLNTYREECLHPASLSLGGHINIILETFSSSSSWILIWIGASVLLCFFLLYRVEGGVPATVILPLLALALLITNARDVDDGGGIFPTERTLITEYLGEERASSLAEQRAQLNRGWELYLVDVWVKEPPAESTAAFAEQVKQGGFFFNLERIYRAKEGSSSILSSLIPPVVPLSLFVLWNAFFFILLSFPPNAASNSTKLSSNILHQ